jgi:tRNA U38,U39,U40 pseudouridine synthase TruA
MVCIRSYAIHNAQAPDAFLAAVSWHYPSRTLDAPAMHGALQTLISERPRDLSALARVERHRHLRELRAGAREAQAAGHAASAQAPAVPVKLQQVKDVRAWRERDMVYVEIQADRFLYGQVRCTAPIGLAGTRCFAFAGSEHGHASPSQAASASPSPHPARAVALRATYTTRRRMPRHENTQPVVALLAWLDGSG